MNSTAVQNISTLIGRLLLSMIFILAGIDKIGSYQATQAYMQSAGVAELLLPVVILLELGGGAMLLIGWKTRITALLLAGFSVLAAILFHYDFNNQIQMIMFMKNLAIAGGLLFVLAFGPGKLSLDRE